jgi:hypothetical protein
MVGGTAIGVSLLDGKIFFSAVVAASSPLRVGAMPTGGAPLIHPLATPFGAVSAVGGRRVDGMAVRWPAVVGIGLGYGCLLAATILGGQQWMSGRETAAVERPWFVFVALLVVLAVMAVERDSARLVPMRSLSAGAITALVGAMAIAGATLLAGERGRGALGAGLAHGALGGMEAVVAVGIFLAQRSAGMPVGEAVERVELPEETRQAA